MHKFAISLAIAAGFGIGANAFAADAMTRDAYKAEKDKIETQAKADKKACDPMKANAKDICQAEAKAKEKIAKAELDAKNKPDARATEKVQLMKAEGEYEVAKEKCEDQQGAAIVACKKDAQASYDKAKTAAKPAAAAPTADAKSKS
ncbi:MAG TPA: hypothetical protein VLJ86_20020 [Ramlibacter sp.]|nr:hypothetical protein [Ramlibacter sp.]